MGGGVDVWTGHGILGEGGALLNFACAMLKIRID